MADPASSFARRPLPADLVRLRLALGVFALGLIFRGCIGFPLRIQAVDTPTPLIRAGMDWFTFGHVVIALFFLGPYLDPARNVFILHVGRLACALVLPVTLVSGYFRGIGWALQFIDCSQGLVGLLILWYCLRLTRRLATSGSLTSRLGGR